MTDVSWLLIGVGAALACWALLVGGLMIGGRGPQARMVARFVPDCLTLFRRLLGDPRVPRARKLLLAAAAGYLAMPIDLVPDFIPVAGHLDDALVVVLVLRAVVRGCPLGVLREHWQGPPRTLELILAAAGRDAELGASASSRG